MSSVKRESEVKEKLRLLRESGRMSVEEHRRDIEELLVMKCPHQGCDSPFDMQKDYTDCFVLTCNKGVRHLPHLPNRLS